MIHDQQEISCKLTPEEQKIRKAEFRQKLFPYLLSKESGNGETVLTFRKTASVENDIKTLIELENSCCEFLTFDVRPGETTLDVAVRGPKGSEALVEEFWGQSASGFTKTSGGCGCASNQKASKTSGQVKASIGFLALCGFACAAPFILAALGAISVSSSIIISEKIEIGVGVAILFVASYFLLKWTLKKRSL